MSTQNSRSGVRSYRRRKVALNLDLNSVPPGDNRNQEGTSIQVGTQNTQSRQQGNSVPPPMIDVEAIDDDVIESSPRAFAAAKNNRRARGRTIVDVESEERNGVGRGNHKCRRASPNQVVINCDLYVNLESSGSSMAENAKKPPPPPKEPTFTCPICMGPLAEETSTKCGHIFCKACIKAAVNAQGKCPTCRKRVTAKELIRVFLPATSC
ncbi:E3 ubiquitin-protein ligase RNF4 [Morus notabilis]|uniref:E3 ubiquitin-protein ligase RNF4 n=1 Tax=Morus notabilis TaxID=981085 RepID=UPI000CECFA7F|nr:E3 ubiquitin-protein ligase RNF4 [Morus notabilis]XP_024026407.1 E3 ubiquitin-protein ligase RNF4 [Morus notabilis]